MLPEPMARMSPLPAALARSRPNGIEPSTYPPSNARNQSIPTPSGFALGQVVALGQKENNPLSSRSWGTSLAGLGTKSRYSRVLRHERARHRREDPCRTRPAHGGREGMPRTAAAPPNRQGDRARARRLAACGREAAQDGAGQA